MNGYASGSCSRPRQRRAHRDLAHKIGYLLSTEEQLLQSISARAPLPEVLNGICHTLDCQIGGVVSLICLLGDDTGELAAIAMNAALFGLHIFWSEDVVAENDELLGSLKVYCRVRRHPSLEEFRLIERAKCLAAMATKRHNEAGEQSNCRIRENRPVQKHVLERLVSMR